MFKFDELRFNTDSKYPGRYKIDFTTDLWAVLHERFWFTAYVGMESTVLHVDRVALHAEDAAINMVHSLCEGVSHDVQV